MICNQCGKETAGEGILFCPYCGAKLAPAGESTPSPEAEEWIRKALKVTSMPERKKILEEAKKACPDEPAIDWELLFVGTPDPKPPRGRMDFSIIKSWLLQIWRKPGEFSEAKRDAMREELFDSPQLRRTLAATTNPEEKMREYLERLCREYIDIFLKEDNQLMGNIFGLRIGRNRDRILAGAVEEMIRRIEMDKKLTEERQKMLADAMRQALRS